MWALMTASEAEAMGELGTIAAGVLGSLRAGRRGRKMCVNEKAQVLPMVPEKQTEPLSAFNQLVCF